MSEVGAVTLTEFLLAQLDADEADANLIRNAITASRGSYATIGLDHPELAAGDCPSFLGDYDPAHVLAQIAAVRAVVGLHTSSGDGSMNSCNVCTDSDYAGLVDEWPCPTVSALAQPYAGRTGWDESWGL